MRGSPRSLCMFSQPRREQWVDELGITAISIIFLFEHDICTTKIEAGVVKMVNWHDNNLHKFERNLCGKIDEFMIWDHCLSAEEIKGLYEAGKPEAPTFLAVK